MSCGFYFQCDGCKKEARTGPMRMPIGWVEHSVTITREEPDPASATPGDTRRKETHRARHYCGDCDPDSNPERRTR